MEIEPSIFEGNKIFFNLFRRELAQAAEIIPVDGYFGTPEDGIDWKYISTLTDFTGYWVEKPKDPIWYLLAHSDSGGYINWEDLKPLSTRLGELKKLLPGSDTLPNWKKFTGNFNKKILEAYSEKQNLIFK